MIPVILSGGSGTRLWPVSRENYPKQFCEFYDKSFMVNTVERLRPFGEPYLLTVETMKSLTYRVNKELGLSQNRVVYEPFAKNTGPAVALMCHLLQTEGRGDEVVGFFPSDHLVLDVEAFHKALGLAEECALSGHVVTLGIQPNYASTGYGYIEIESEVVNFKGELKAFRAKNFLEKPKAPVAEKFLASGVHFWNAGMFVFKVSVMVELFKEHLPEMWGKISKIKPDLSNAKYQYANCESISFDYAIMEKLSQSVCVPCRIGWSDIGSWDEIARISEEIPDLKIDSKAKVFSVDSQSNYIFSQEDKVLGLVGVEDLIIVDTSDALLVAKKGESQKVSQIVKELRATGMSQAIEHRFEKRPWGHFEILREDPNYKSKVLTVEPGESLSYQSHQRRQEHWVIVEGAAEVVLDGQRMQLSVGESVMAPAGSKHRISNPHAQKLVFIEVQTGEYFGEDDVVRYDDEYDRK